MRRLILPAVLLAAVALAQPAPAAAAARLVTRPIGAPPLSDRQAAKQVVRSSWEPRPDNRDPNHRMPSAAELQFFRANSTMPYRWDVTGHFTGTTDEIIQWAAHKWGFSPNLIRAVAVVESWWHMSTLGDSGHSFGLTQVRIPYHCCYPLIRESTAFNVDYYGANLRAVYDGRYGWLNTVPRGRQYKAGDVWGSVGEWYSGRWHLGSDRYVAMVQKRMRARTWRTDRWF